MLSPFVKARDALCSGGLVSLLEREREREREIKCPSTQPGKSEW